MNPACFSRLIHPLGPADLFETMRNGTFGWPGRCHADISSYCKYSRCPALRFLFFVPLLLFSLFGVERRHHCRTQRCLHSISVKTQNLPVSWSPRNLMAPRLCSIGVFTAAPPPSCWTDGGRTRHCDLTEDTCGCNYLWPHVVLSCRAMSSCLMQHAISAWVTLKNSARNVWFFKHK